MAAYDDFKKKAKEALDTIADVSLEAYKVAEEKAKILARRTRLSAEITREKAAIRRTKIRIGDIYYEQHANSPEDSLKEFCESVTTSLDLIASKQRELEELKKKAVVDDAETEECEPECDCKQESDNNDENQG